MSVHPCVCLVWYQTFCATKNDQKWAENNKIRQKIAKNGLKLTKMKRVRENKVRENMYRAKMMVREN